jgi:electron transport complex protein RnfC
MKRKTKQQSIQHIPDASVLYLPLSQHIGLPATPTVSVGDRVLKYQLIAKASGTISANIHAPVSGIIRSIVKHPLADGREVDTVILENDFKEETIQQSIVDYRNLSGEALLACIQQSGIVGEGGAQFPTHVKYNVQGQKINTFIINGTECEPYLTADYALMRERTQAIFEGITIVNKLIQANEIVLSIEKQNKDLLAVFQPFLAKAEYRNVRVLVLPNKYPQGGELQLIQSVTGKELPRAALPRDIGVVVSNVGTVYAVYEAVVNQKPLTERIITLSGEKSINYGNFNVKIGTPLADILQTQAMNTLADDTILVLGGPMMGKSTDDLSIPITKGSSGVLFFKKKNIERSNCIACGYCVDVCPMKLMPLEFAEKYRLGKIMALEKYSINTCIECAACEYICPSNVPLMESIKEGKQKLKLLMRDADKH